MPSPRNIVALAAAASAANAYQGFNYGATRSDGSIRSQQDFEDLFKAAADLEGTNGGFTSARLFTMIQGPSANDPISAIPAAINTKTSLLFGLWASAGDEVFNNEIAALQNTIDQYCDQLDGLVAGISVGSEDLYRNSPTGQEAGENPGANPDTLVGYISRVRDTVRGSCLADAPIGHVDTWTAYVNATNNPVIEACDFIGMDAYPFFESTKENPIENGAELFQSALDATRGAVGDKEVWITETGWPTSGKESGQAVASIDNAEAYYKAVGCPRFGKTNIWWYTLQNSNTDPSQPSFGVVGTPLTPDPLYDLSCDNTEDTKSSSSASSARSTSTRAAQYPVGESSSVVNEEPVFTGTTATDDEPAVTGTQNSTVILTLSRSGVPATTLTTTVGIGHSGNGTLPVETGSGTGSDGRPVPTGSNSSPGNGGSPSTGDEPTSTGVETIQTDENGNEIPAAGTQLNSFGAAFVAMIVALCML